MRINFDFLDLEAFLAVKDSGSFHVAAERLNLSQSSVTRRIRKLEEALGSVLFERTTRDVKPTLAAKRLQLRAEAILQDAQETTRALRDESAAYAYQRAQTVTVATVPTALGALIIPAIQRFREEGNRARVRLMDLAANEVAEAVAQGEADFGVCSLPMLEPTTEFTLLFDEPMVLAVHEGHMFAGRDGVTWRDLSEEALILPARGTGNRLQIDEALARSQTGVAWTYEVGRSSTALDLVAQRVGVAPVPKMALDSVEGRGVSGIPITGPEVSRPIGLLSRVGYQDTGAVAAFKAALMASIT